MAKTVTFRHLVRQRGHMKNIKPSAPLKTLTIEWKHLDREGRTCDRCGDTGTSLRHAVRRLRRCMEPRGIAVRLVETRLPAARLEESNMILFNNVPLEGILNDARVSDSDCPSCGELLGAPTRCRTIERDGKTHEAIPESLICAAACRVTGCAGCDNCTPETCGSSCGC